MIFRRLAVLTFALMLTVLGLSACTRERPPWPDTNPFDISPGEVVPRFTPHVTLQPTPTPLTPAPKFITATPTLAPPAPTPTPVHASGIYIVQPGDTLYDIARAYNVSLQELAEINHITDPTTIMVGQQLLLP